NLKYCLYGPEKYVEKSSFLQEQCHTLRKNPQVVMSTRYWNWLSLSNIVDCQTPIGEILLLPPSCELLSELYGTYANTLVSTQITSNH
ncbi:hypothetical protein L9F63_004280, partial [Diploptera punctata]